MTRIAPLVGLLAAGLAAQDAPVRTAFDAVSIRPSNFVFGNLRITMTGGPGTADPGRVTFTNYVLSDLITRAWGFDISNMSGPDWLMNPGMDSPRFDIAARLPAATTTEEFQLMLRDMLATRFKLTVHRETRDRPIYNLTVARNGPKLRSPATPPDPDGFPILPPGEDVQVFNKTGGARMHAVGVSMETLATRLSRRANLGRPVRDTTGIPGSFDFVLSWQLQGSTESDSLPGIFEALPNQLGLRLVPSTGPVETLVIDHLEKIPTDN